MSNATFRIIYCSRNAMGAGADRAEIEQILAVSRRNNAAAGVTGALLYNDGIFAQTLEGPFDAVQTVFERIQSDPRHDGVVILQAEDVPGRLFAEWSMAHAEPSDPAALRRTVSRALLEPDDAAAPALLDMLGDIVIHAAS